MNDAKESNFLPLGSPSLIKSLCALIVLLLGVYFYFFEAFISLSQKLIGGFSGDAGIYLWLVKRNSSELFTLPWFDTNAFYPYIKSLAWSDNFIAPSIVFGAINSVVADDILSWNILMLGALLLNGYATFRLLYSITARFDVSLAAGICALSFLPIVSHLGHPQLVFFFLVIYFISSLLRFLSSASLWSALLTGLLVTLTFLTSVYYAVFEGLILGSICVALALAKPHFFSRSKTVRFFIGLTLGLFPLVPFALPYLTTKAIFGGRGLYEAFYFSANAASYFSTSDWSRWYAGLSGLSHSEASLFGGAFIILGIFFALPRFTEIDRLKKLRALVLAFFVVFFASSFLSPYYSMLKWLVFLSGWGVIVTLGQSLRTLGCLEKERGVLVLTNRAMLGMLLFSSFVFIFCSFGPLGNPEKNQWAPGFYSFLYYLVPGFEGVRAISRAGIVAMYFVLILYFLSIWRLVESQRYARAKWLLYCLLALPCLEQALAKFPLESYTKAPEIVTSNIALTDREVTLALPYAGKITKDGGAESWVDFATKNVTFMNWFLGTNRWLVNGYSGLKSKITRELPKGLANFPDDRSIKTLSSLGALSKIFIFPHMISDYSEEVFTSKLALYKDQLKILSRDSAGNFLIGFAPRVLISPDFRVVVPGDVLSLDISLEKSSTCPKTPVVVQMTDSVLEGKEIASFTLQNKTETFSLPLSKALNARWIGFRSADCPLYYTGVGFK